MAFFNLWSSERLSFSLSIVAVISAAITSYYQFFYSKSNLSVRYTNVEYTIDDSLWVGTLRLSGVLMNSGTTDLVLVGRDCQMTTDHTNRGNIHGIAARMMKCNEDDYVTKLGPRVAKDFEPIAIEAHTSEIFDFTWEFPHDKVSKLASTRSTHDVGVSFFAEFVTPSAEVLARRMRPGEIIFMMDSIVSWDNRVLPLARRPQGVSYIEPYTFTVESQSFRGLDDY